MKVKDNVVFKTVGETELELMLFLPKEPKLKKAPLMVYIHGGGWGGGDRYKVLRPGIIDVIRGLNEAGIVCASVEYRLADGGDALVVDSVADCKDAVRYLVQHAADYGIDTERVGTFGSSAGGHLTLMTALGDPANFPLDPTLTVPPVEVDCVASYYPLVSFVDPELKKGGNFERPQRLVPLIGGLLEEKTEVAHMLSPIELLKEDSPPIFLAHGDKDTVLHVRNAEAMRDAAEAKGVPVECIISEGAGHGFRGEGIDPSMDEISQRTIDFFLKYLLPE